MDLPIHQTDRPASYRQTITMLCNFQDLQAESSAVLAEADVRKRFNLACKGLRRCISCAIFVMSSISVATAKAWFDFYKQKICISLVKKPGGRSGVLPGRGCPSEIFITNPERYLSSFRQPYLLTPQRYQNLNPWKFHVLNQLLIHRKEAKLPRVK